MPRTHLDRAFSPLVLVSCVWLLAAPAANTYRVEKFEARIGGSTKAITGALISAAFFPAAARPLFGRVFVSEEYHSDRPAVVVIGNSLWRESFGADPGTIGRKIPLNGRDFIVIGVMPSGFAAPKGVDLWIPLPP